MANKLNLWSPYGLILLAILSFMAGCSTLKLNPYNLVTKVLPLPWEIPISYDDFTYNAQMDKVIIPGGETGQVALINPKDMSYQLISGFSQQTEPNNPIIGTSAVAIANGYMFGLDQETQAIITIDLNNDQTVSSTPLQDAPDYIRYISVNNELWVTEKNSSQIEIFSMTQTTPPTLKSILDIPIPNGPEALVIDDQRGLAFTNRPKQGLTDVISVLTHTVIAQWGNGCSAARGIAIDENQGYLFVACNEGKVVVMDIDNDGLQVTNIIYGSKLDFIAYNPNLHHIYLPSSTSGILGIFQLQTLLDTPTPELTNPPGTTATVSPTATTGPTPTPNFHTSIFLIGTADTAVKSKCVTTDNENNIYVCNPNNGQVFVIHDTFPDTSSLP